MSDQPQHADTVVNQIRLGSALDLLVSLPSASMDLVVTSPPYNIGKGLEQRKALDLYVSEQTDVLAECVRVLNDRGSLFWQVGSYSFDGTLIPLDVRFFPVLERLGMQPRNRIVWTRPHGLHARNKFSARYETILWFTKTNDYRFNLDAIRVPQKYPNKKAWRGERKGELTCHPGGKNPGDVWAFQNVKHNHEEQTIHPCQFPEGLVARIILATTAPGGCVLDPYMGSGTVAVAARDAGRDFVGAEIELAYHVVAMHRLSGEPDGAGRFPNLKTLRAYASRTGRAPSEFSFATQTALHPTLNKRGRSEQDHLNEMYDRLDGEECA